MGTPDESTFAYLRHGYLSVHADLILAVMPILTAAKMSATGRKQRGCKVPVSTWDCTAKTDVKRAFEMGREDTLRSVQSGLLARPVKALA
ncbi:hypothetical protein DWU99_16315 [Dyella psychrodurans]|uniref:Uncharacterized protein n=1 Tax=Dyella psychrodurans TaxID=1927960 RepID=A0A370X0U9_9GAMM|nr:hypothetical protein DWU99_16315 [Dyella psychrodurans]